MAVSLVRVSIATIVEIACSCSVYEGEGAGDGEGSWDSGGDGSPPSTAPTQVSSAGEEVTSTPTPECDAASAMSCVGDESIEFCDGGVTRTTSCTQYCAQMSGIERMDAECDAGACLCGDACEIVQPSSGMYSVCSDPGPMPICSGFAGSYYCAWVVDAFGNPTSDAFCSTACTTDAQCPASGCSAAPVCRTSADDGTRYCALDCSGGRGCPVGMECREVVDGR